MSRAAARAGTVSRRPNHYETLGVSPTAAWDEIARAFAKEGSVFRPQAFGRLAELCIAYETLRDPVKRRAYDASIGLKPEPKVAKFAAGARQALIAKGPVNEPINRPANSEAPLPAPERKPAFPLTPSVESPTEPEPRISVAVSPRLSLEEELGVEARPIEWRRTGFVLGGVVAVACVVGGLAGWWSSSAIGETPQPGNVVSLPLPPAKPAATAETPPIAAAPMDSVPEMLDEPPEPSVAVAAPVQDLPAASDPVTAEQPAEGSQADPGLSAETDEDAAATPAVTAAMPLPDRVIARTIERIGYSCGRVASTAPVEGEAPGVFKVTCSSGQSYRASPVNGRYRFRRWDKR